MKWLPSILLLLVVNRSPIYSFNKAQITYLMHAGKIEASLDLYEKYRKEQSRDEPETLRNMARIILEQGMNSSHMEHQLSTLFAINIAQLHSPFKILEKGIRSIYYEVQMATIQIIGAIQDDQGDDLFIKAMDSPFIGVRIQAGFHLAQRKHPKASGFIEALMDRLPPEASSYFPQLFAIISSPNALSILKKLIDHPFSKTRVEAILSAARSGRDDFLPKIRAHATHLYEDEQEACASALGLLRDSKSIPQLRLLSQRSSPSVQIAALRSLYILGETQAASSIALLAEQQNLFAVALLGEISGKEELLLSFLQKENIQLRFNAMLALLHKRDRRCLKAVKEFLFQDNRGLGFEPFLSEGHSLQAWKIIPSFYQQKKRDPARIAAISLELKEKILSECLELPEEDFIDIAQQTFEKLELSLVPVLMQLLKNHPSESVLSLLKKYGEKSISPLIRAYCHLVLYALGHSAPYEKRVIEWMVHHSQSKICFRPLSLKEKEPSIYELNPEEHSALSLEIYKTFAEKHDEKGLDFLFKSLKNGNRDNRFLIAGLLLLSLQ